MKRLLEIDIFRGLLLLVMVVNHTPSPLRALTTQPLGFVSAAEAFVFVSACLCGLVFSHKYKSDGLLALKQVTRRRLRQIYIGHLLTLLFCLVVVGQWLGHLAPFYNMIHPYLQHPTPAALSALFLLYQPPLLDILPMYLVFMALTPWTIRMAARMGWSAVLTVSLLLWLAAQFGLKEWLVSALAGDWLVVDPGAFNLFSWQLIWVLGMMLGQHLQRHPGRSRVISLPKPFWMVLIGIALFFFGWRWIPVFQDLGDHAWLLDKWQLGPLRLLNLFALLILVLWQAPALGKMLIWLKPLAVLGRHMLPVFCLHVCFSLLAAGFVELYALSDSWCCLILSLHLTLIFCVSFLLERYFSSSFTRNPAARPLRG